MVCFLLVLLLLSARLYLRLNQPTSAHIVICLRTSQHPSPLTLLEIFILTHANHYILASMYEQERVSSNNCFLNFTTWMTMFFLALSKLILSPSSRSHLKDMSTTPILLLPKIIFIFLLPVGTKPDFQVLKQKKRNCTINRNNHYTELSGCFLYLQRTFLFLFT